MSNEDRTPTANDLIEFRKTLITGGFTPVEASRFAEQWNQAWAMDDSEPLIVRRGQSVGAYSSTDRKTLTVEVSVANDVAINEVAVARAVADAVDPA